MKPPLCPILCALVCLFSFEVALIAVDTPIANPIIYQALTPVSVAPGGPDFTLIVMGNGFHTGSVIYWNDTPLTTTVLTTRFVSAVIPAALTATAQTASV